MKWYKHFTDNHRGQIVQNLINLYGHAGPCAYYFIMELCAEKIEKSNFEEISGEFLFVFKRPYFDNVLRMKRKSTDNILRTLSESNALLSEPNDNEVRIKFPKLLNLLDRDLKKARSDRARDALKARLDKDKDKDKDIYKQNTLSLVFDFEPLYSKYPRKDGKSKGMVICNRDIKTQEDYDGLSQAIDRYRQIQISIGAEKKFIKQFSTFMGCWKDYRDGGSAEESEDFKKIKQDPFGMRRDL